MDISIIIVSWNVRELLKKCLESVFAQTKENTPINGVSSDDSAKGSNPTRQSKNSIADSKNLSSAARVDGTGLEPASPRLTSRVAYQLAEPPTRVASDIISQFEIIVVDNASSDGTVEMVSSFAKATDDKAKIRVIANDKNLGFAAANNQGIKEAKGEYILLLNPDTEFIENSLEKIIAKMQSDEKIGVLGCKLLNSDKTIQPSVRRFPTVWSQLVILFKLHKIFPFLLNSYLAKDFDHPPAPSLVKEGESTFSPPPVPRRGLGGGSEVDQVMGAFFCVRKSLFDKIGLLDEGYFIWFEEVDFCRRAKQAGYKVVYWPGTSVVHHAGQSFAQQMTLKKQLWFFKSAWRYFRKNVKVQNPNVKSRPND